MLQLQTHFVLTGAQDVPVVPVPVANILESVDDVAGAVCSVFVDDVVGVEIEQPCIGDGCCAGGVP